MLAGNTYVASYFVPAGHYSADDVYFATQAVESSPLRAPSGLERIRTLMDEIDETRQRELDRGSPEVAVLAPRDAESRSTP